MAIDENGVVTFTPEEQAKVDEIVKERLARVKNEKPEDYDDLKEIAEEIGEFFEGATPSEKKAAIKAYKAELAAQKELEELQKQAQDEGTSPALLKEIQEAKKAAKEANDKLAAIEKAQNDKENAKKEEEAREANYQAARKELLEKHDVDADDLQKNDKFMKFIKGKKDINLIEEYESFVEFIGETEAETIVKFKSKESRSTSSGKGASSDGATYGLNNRQQELAKKNGMTYKEYAEILQNVQ